MQGVLAAEEHAAAQARLQRLHLLAQSVVVLQKAVAGAQEALHQAIATENVRTELGVHFAEGHHAARGHRQAPQVEALQGHHPLCAFVPARVAVFGAQQVAGDGLDPFWGDLGGGAGPQLGGLDDLGGKQPAGLASREHRARPHLQGAAAGGTVDGGRLAFAGGALGAGRGFFVYPAKVREEAREQAAMHLPVVAVPREGVLEFGSGSQNLPQLPHRLAPVAHAGIGEVVLLTEFAHAVAWAVSGLLLEGVPQVEQSKEVALLVVPLGLGLACLRLLALGTLAGVGDGKPCHQHQYVGQAALLGRTEQDARRAWIERKPRHVAARGGEPQLFIHCAQFLQ